MMFGYGRPVRAQVVPPAPPCNMVSGGTVTCTGNVSSGIDIDQYGPAPDTFDTLIVRDVTADITPASGVDGIYFGSEGSVTINSDTTDGPGGPFAIIATGYNTHGVHGFSYTGTTIITHRGDVITRGDYAAGIYAESLSGTTVTHRGDITTEGYSSPGLDGFSYSGSVSITQRGEITTRGDYGYGIYALAPDGGVSINQTGTIRTRGYSADGIYVQGYRSAAVNQTGDIYTQGDYAAGINAVSYFGGTRITQTGNITTTGYSAPGIAALGIRGPVTVDHTGDITTTGEESFGILAQSYSASLTIRNEGRITTRGPFADGISVNHIGPGTVSITQTGDIEVLGNGSDAIDVNQIPGVGASVVTIRAGSTITGGPAGDGIDFDGGATNRVINYGTITTRGENAIEADGSSAETVDNYGTVTGNIDLGPGSDRFNNRAGGLFNTGARVFLGTGELLRNAGTMSPGGTGRVRTTALTGNVLQTGSGIFAVDLNLGNAAADRLNVSGTAELEGNVKVSVQNPARLSQRFTILSAAGGTTDNGLGLLASPALQAELLYPNPNDVVLDVAVNFVPDGLNRNQRAIGTNLNTVLDAGGGTLDPVFLGLLNVYSLKAYTDALDQLSPEIYADIQLSAVYSASDFSDNLLSCRVNGTDTASINREGQCLWLGAKGRDFDADATFEDIGFDETAGQFAAGGQVALNGDWRLGGGLGFQSSSLSTSSGATSDGEQLQGGLALKYNPGPLLLAGAVSGAHGWYETQRTMNFGGFSESAEASHDLDVVQGRLHGSYVLGSPTLYYKPMIDAAVTNVDLGNIKEHGAGGASLAVDGDHTVFSLSPAVEFGTEWWWSNGTLVRPYVRAGVTWYSEDEVTVAASFSGAPSSVSPFTIVADTDNVQADIAAGVELITAGNSSVRVFYDGQFGDRVAVQAAGFKAGVKF
ncbi:autotransporter outer membrane beta-barrel domain-containing protein [Methyloligella solikamskensis]|uniref:Autotransporter domain-containing protein n=1 Tax=Methyloligella solikamskensis TaxID=1177756 RepID=A0ABW3J6C8_9HYPH